MSLAVAPLLSPLEDPISTSPPLRALVAARAARHRPPQSRWRVLVGNDLGGRLAAPYLEVHARVVGCSDSEPDPRYHVRLPSGLDGLPAPHRPDDADLLLLVARRSSSVSQVLRAVGQALAPGGIAVVALAAHGHARSTHVVAAGLELRELNRVSTIEGHFDLLVVADQRAADPLDLDLPLDRSSCVDRGLIRRALDRGPWSGPTPSRPAGSTAALLAAVREQLGQGRLDVRRLPWPRPKTPAPTDVLAGCDVLALMPHPDDESVYAGGTLAGLTTAGQRVHLVVATDGAGGRGGDALAQRRARELLTAAEILKLDGLRCLGWADFGKYRDPARTTPVTATDTIRAWGLDPALEALVAEIRRARPACVLSLGPEVDPNLSLHGHHLGLGVLAMLAFVAAADPEFAPHAGPAWACAEHRVMAPQIHAIRGDAPEIDRAPKRRALVAHATQSYSTAGLLARLDDPERPAIEVSRPLLRHRPHPWVLARAVPKPEAEPDWRHEHQRVLATPRPRAAVVEALRRQAARHGLDPATERSLAMLRRDDSVAVVTGQQVGLLGGPVYTLAKALEAVALSRRLRNKGIPAVPVFWLASQDHDLAEVQTVPRLEAPPLSLGLRHDGRPVGSRGLGPDVEELVDRWLANLPQPQPQLTTLLRRTHRATDDFTGAFTAFLRAVTEGTGLLVLDPAAPSLTTVAHPVLRRALTEAPAVEAALAAARGRLGHEVVRTRPGHTQVFMLDDQGVRRRVVRSASEPVDPQVLTRLDERPGRGSAAALLRPLVQDTLLPTIAQIAGPTEARYLAQLDELYRWADVPAPRIVRRPSIHLLRTEDLEPLRDAGGVERLRAASHPLALIGRAGLTPAGDAWITEVEGVLGLVEGMRRRIAQRRPLDPSILREGVARIDYRAAVALPFGGRTAAHWPITQQALRQRFDAMFAAPTAHHLTRLRHGLGRLHRSLLRDGRRAHPRAVAAWRRVGSDPAPAERRMTVAEWLARGGRPHAVLAALEAHPCASVTLQIGGRA